MSLSLWLYAIPEALDSSLSQEKKWKVSTLEKQNAFMHKMAWLFTEKNDGIITSEQELSVFSEAAGYQINMCKDQHCFYTLMEIKIRT